jgi:nicotinate-nucleotide adenylyltransferase
MTERAGVRVGIFGGTLDPIHVGHLETVRAAQHALALSRVLVMPVRVPPHRTQGPCASTFHRFAMAALAVPDVPEASVSDVELSADGPSYTASTLERLAATGLRSAETFFITGADAFAEIETWYRYPEVLDLCHFVVVSRPGVPVSTMPARLPQLGPRFRQTKDGLAGDATPGIFLVDAATPDVSSTDIRRRLRAGTTIAGLVPKPVENHIRRHGLYANTAQSGTLA